MLNFYLLGLSLLAASRHSIYTCVKVNVSLKKTPGRQVKPQLPLTSVPQFSKQDWS